MNQDQIKALDKLIAAVDDGAISRSDLDAFIPSLGLTTQSNDAHSAYKGSLDAAKALHEALLPDQLWEITPLGNVYIRDIEYNQLSRAFVTSNPARAWLIAILKAYRAHMAAITSTSAR